MRRLLFLAALCTLLGAWTSAKADSYELYIGETQVTDENCADVLGTGTTSRDVKNEYVTIASRENGSYGFEIAGNMVTKDNYDVLSNGGTWWSYDAEANVLHLKDGRIDADATSALVIRGDINPTLNISVDGACTFMGTFTDGLVFYGNGTHTVCGSGTLNIESRVVSPTSVQAVGGAPSVTFKDLNVNIKQYGGVGFNNASFGSITFDWCDFKITTSDGFALYGGMSATAPEWILCGDRTHRYGWSDGKGGGISGNSEDAGLFASDVFIRREVKYINVAIDEPAPGQKPATTARALSPAYKVTQISWWEVDNTSGGLSYMAADAVFEDNKVYMVQMGIEAAGDSIINLLPEMGGYRVFSVNGKKGTSYKRASGGTVYGGYYFDEKFRISEVSLTGDPIAVGKNPPSRLAAPEGGRYTVGSQPCWWEEYNPEEDSFEGIVPAMATLKSGVTYRLTLPYIIMAEGPYCFPRDREDLTLRINGEKMKITGGSYSTKGFQAQCLITLESPASPYDLNGDGSVDVSDVTILVGYVLNPDGSHATDYDLNKDGAVDVSDVTELVSTVLAQ